MKQKKIFKRALSLLLAVVLVAGTITVMGPNTPAVVEAASDNLITNGGFDTITDWTYTGADDSTGSIPAQESETVMEPNVILTADCEDSSNDSRWVIYNTTGTAKVVTDSEDETNKVASFTHTDNSNTGMAYKPDNGFFEKEKTYTISFRYKGTAQFHVFTLGLLGTGYSIVEENGEQAQWLPIKENEWTTYSFDITPTLDVSSSQAQRIMFQMATSGGGTFYIDDLTVTCGEVAKTKEVETEMFSLNFDDESNYSTGWNNEGAQTMSYDNGAMKYTSKESGVKTFYYQKEQAFYGTNSTYKISYRYKSDVLARTYVFGFCGNVSSSTAYTWFDQSLVVSEEWQSKTFTITTSASASDMYSYPRIYFGTNAAGSLWIDDLVVEKVETVTATTYTQGIGDCKVNGVAMEDNNVLYVEDYVAIATPVTIEANKKYEYTFQMKHDATGSDFDFNVQVDGTKVGDVTSGTLAASEWETVSGTFTATTHGATFGFLRSGEGNVYIDDVKLVEVPTDHTPTLDADYIPSSASVLFNDDIGTTRNGVVCSGTQGTDYVYEDGLIKLNMSAGNTYMTTRQYELTKGHTYVFSFYVWIQNANNLQVEVAQNTKGAAGPTGQDKREDYLLYYSSNYDYSITVDGVAATDSLRNDTSGWKEVKLTWEALETGTMDFLIRSFGYSGTGTIYIDDIALYDNSAATAEEQLLLNYYDLGSNNEGYLVTSGADETVTITDSEGNEKTVENGTYTTINEAGEYTITRGSETSEIVLYKRGDANSKYDSTITAKDLVATKKKVAEVVIDGADSKAADINADGVLDSKDDDFLRRVIVNDYDIINTQKGVSSLGQGVMPIIGYNGPTNAEGITQIADLGLNYVVVNETDISDDVELAEEILAAAEENGIKVYLNNDSAVNPDGDSAVKSAEKLASYNSEYDSYASFAGYYVSNDVYYKKQTTSDSGVYFANNGIAEYKKVLDSATSYLNVNTYMNLLSASSEELGYSISGDETSTTISYKQYLAYTKAASDAGSDFLPYSMFLKDSSTYAHKEEAFYTNLDWMRSISFEKDIDKPFYATVQTGVDFNDDNTADTEDDNLLTAAEMYLEANAALAMGAKGIQYNAVVQKREWAKNNGNASDPYDYARSGLLNAKGEPNTAYYIAAQRINNYIASIDYILMDATNKGAIATNTDIAGYISGAKVEKFGALASVSDTNNNALVGCFEYFGKDTFLVTNTSATEATTVTLNFSETVNGIVKTFDCTSDKFSAQSTYKVTLGAGESALIVLGYESGDQGVNVEETPVEEEISLASQTSLATTIETANEIANDVQAYYKDSTKTEYVIENQNMKLTHGTKSLTSITNKNGVAYPTQGNSFDIIVKYDGKYYYSNSSTTNTWVNTTKLGYYYYETNLWDLDFGSSVPNLYLEKTYHTYPDKMHQAFRVISDGADTEKVTEITFRTTFKVSDVTSMEMLTKSDETVTTVTSSAPATNLEYAGFYFEGVGVIGFIAAGTGTSLQVTTDGSIYYVSQNVSANAIDFTSGEVSFGNRVYTDSTSSFEGLKQANEEEQNPLTSANISVDTSVDKATFSGYDHLTGAYIFNVDGYSLGEAFADGQKKFYENITVQGVDEERMIYLDVHTDTDLEAATLIQNNKQIPIPLQVSKNFAGENIKEIYNPDTTVYGDTYLPLCVKPDETYKFSVVNLYEDWGSQDIRLKQLSSIEFYTSYYHLSTGVRETNCIAPYYAANGYKEYYQDTAWIMPDFRGVSTDPKPDSPNSQKSSVGILRGPTNGDYLATYESSDIQSAGLTHADLDYSYVSDDGKYRYTIRQVEMPQEDEARTYYTIEFEILEDCTLKKSEFEIVGFNGARCRYNKAAYLDTSGVHIEKDTSYHDGLFTDYIQNIGYYNLNHNGAYFALYDLEVFDTTDTTLEAGNLGVIVKESDLALAFRHTSIETKYWNTQEQNYAALTLASDTTFTAGETFKVDLVLLPFGSKGQDDCQNVIDVYNDSVANPLTISTETGTVVEDTFVPTVKAEDNVADFTLTGGVTEGNTDGVIYTVKVTNFDTLGNPVIQEYVNGQWITYEYYTELGYDGYSVEYEDGRLSYSFTFKQTDADAGRRFRVIKPKDANVNYYVNGEMIKSVNVKAEQTVIQPTDAELGIIGHKILGFYADEAYIKEFEFGQYLTGDVNVYVEVSDELYITAEQLETFKATFADTKTVSDGTLILGTEQEKVNMYLFARDLNIDVSKTPTLKLTVPSTTNVDSMFVKLIGTYVDGDGKTQTIEVTSEVENENDWSNWNTTSYVLYPNANNTVPTRLLTKVFNSTTTVSSYLTITGIMLYANPTDNTKAQELQISSVECVRDAQHTVSYVANGEIVKTETVNDGQKLNMPTDMDTYVMGYEVQGYYRDAEYTTKHDFGNWITTDTTVYVKTSDTFYVSPTALATYNKANTVSSVTMLDDGATRIIGTGDVYMYKNGLSSINVENQTLEMKVKTSSNVTSISMYVHGTYTKDGTEGSIAGFTGGYYAMFTKVGEDSEGYSIYTLDFSNVNGYNWKTLTGFRIGAYNASELTLDVQYIRAIKATE